MINTQYTCGVPNVSQAWPRSTLTLNSQSMGRTEQGRDERVDGVNAIAREASDGVFAEDAEQDQDDRNERHGDDRSHESAENAEDDQDHQDEADPGRYRVWSDLVHVTPV